LFATFILWVELFFAKISFSEFLPNFLGEGVLVEKDSGDEEWRGFVLGGVEPRGDLEGEDDK
jgi:hypothetical protein